MNPTTPSRHSPHRHGFPVGWLALLRAVLAFLVPAVPAGLAVAQSPALSTLPAPAPIPVVDVLVVYFPEFLQLETDPNRRIAEALDQANRLFVNSQAGLHLRLVQVAKLSKVEYPDFFTTPVSASHLARLLDPWDGIYDEVHRLRDERHADVVLLIAGSGSPDGVLAATQTARADTAFALIAGDSRSLGISIAHQLGHLLGCGETAGELTWRRTLPVTPAFPFAHSHTLTNRFGGVLATLMEDRQNGLPYFSNPELRFDGEPLGLPDQADNVRAIRLRAPELSAFRPPADTVVPPVLHIVSPTNALELLAPASFEIVATLPEGSPPQAVEFVQASRQFLGYAETPQALGTLDRPPYRWPITNLAAGWYTFEAWTRNASGALARDRLEVHVRPLNDDFARRIRLSGQELSVRLALYGATTEPAEPLPAGVRSQSSLWFSWTARGSGTVRLSTPQFASQGPQVAIYRGDPLDALTLVTWGTPTPEYLQLPPVEFAAADGEVFQIQVLQPEQVDPVANWDLGTLDLRLYPPLPNDDFSNRLPLSNLGQAQRTHAVGATVGPGEPITDVPSAWWTWTAPADGWARVISRSDVQHTLALFRGEDLARLTPLGRSTGAGGNEPTLWALVHQGENLQISLGSHFAAWIDLRVDLESFAANDAFDDAAPLAGDSVSVESNWRVSTEPGDPLGPYTRWWIWQAPRTGVAFADPGRPNARLGVYQGSTLATIVPVVVGTAGQHFEARAGEVYRIGVGLADEDFAGGRPSFGIGGLLLALGQPNDRFENRLRLEGPSAQVTLANRLAVNRPDPPFGQNLGQGQLWWEWTAPQRGFVSLQSRSEGPGAFVRFQVARDPQSGGTSSVSLIDLRDARGVGFYAQTGERFFLIVDGCPPEAPAPCFDPFTWSLQLESLPRGDDFADRLAIPAAGGTFHAERMELATVEEDEPPRWISTPHSQWWTWIAPQDGMVEIPKLDTSLPGGGSTVLEAFQGETLKTLQRVGDANYSALRLLVTRGQALQIRLVALLEAVPFELRFSPGVHNDTFAHRQPLTGANVAVGSTTQLLGPAPLPSDEGELSAWFEWQAPTSGRIRVEALGPIGGAFQFLSVSPLPSASPAPEALPSPAERQARSPLFFTASAGQRYALQFRTAKSAAGPVDVTITTTPNPPAPANDSFAARVALGSSPTGQIQAQLRFASAESGEPPHAGVPAARSGWWTWTAPRSGRLGVTVHSALPTAGPPSDPPATREDVRLAVYSGGALDALTEIARGTSAQGEGSLTIDATVTAGVEYALALDAARPRDTDLGDVALEWIVRPPNDDFDQPLPLTGMEADLVGTTIGATAQPGDPASLSGPATVWWSWTAPADGLVSLRREPGEFHDWVLLEASPVAPGWNELARGSAGGDPEATVRRGREYRVVLASYDPRGQPASLRLRLVARDLNDAFSARRTLTGSSAEDRMRVVSAGLEPDEPRYPTNAVGSVWWTWTAPAAGRFTLYAWPELGNRLVFGSVYRGDSLATLVPVVQAATEVVFTAEAGTTYQIAATWPPHQPFESEFAPFQPAIRIDPTPLNDQLADAAVLDGFAPYLRGDLRGATHDTPDTSERAVWAKWTAPATGLFQTRGQGTSWQVLTENDRGELVPTFPVNGVDFQAEAGRTYWLRFFSGLTGPPSGGEFEVYLTLDLAGRNDAFIHRQPLAGPHPALRSATPQASAEPDEPWHQGQPARNSLWWSWIAPASGPFALTDPRAAVYTGANLAGLSPVPSFLNTRSEMQFAAVAGQEYQIALNGPGGLYFPEASPITQNYVQASLGPIERPSNDDFAARLPVPSDNDTLPGTAPATGTNLGATHEPGEPAHREAPGVGSVWWTWRAPKDGMARLQLHGPQFLLSVAVYSGESLDQLVPIGRNETGGVTSQQVAFPVRRDQVYSIAVDSAASVAGAYRFAIDFVAEPRNDQFATRLPWVGTDLFTHADNVGASTDPAEALATGLPVTGSLWWEWTAPASGPVLITTAGSDFDTVLAVFAGTPPSAANLVAVNDDSAVPWPNRPSTVEFEAVANTSYAILVGGYAGTTGTTRLSLTQTRQPKPVQFIDAQVFANGEFGLVMSGPPGTAVRLEMSSDLKVWFELQRILFSAEPSEVRIPTGFFPGAQFFRLRP